MAQADLTKPPSGRQVGRQAGSPSACTPHHPNRRHRLVQLCPLWMGSTQPCLGLPAGATPRRWRGAPPCTSILRCLWRTTCWLAGMSGRRRRRMRCVREKCVRARGLERACTRAAANQVLHLEAGKAAGGFVGCVCATIGSQVPPDAGSLPEVSPACPGSAFAANQLEPVNLSNNLL